MIESNADRTYAGSADPDANGEFDELVYPFRSFVDQEDRIRDFVRAHPISVVAGALVLGFAIARVIRGVSG
jgi:hypothetical protein